MKPVKPEDSVYIDEVGDIVKIAEALVRCASAHNGAARQILLGSAATLLNERVLQIDTLRKEPA